MIDESEGGAGAAIAAAGMIGASAINAGSQYATNKWQMKLAQYSYDQQRQMIAEQNAYNSPLEQMKRYEEAGLNPNLIYGEGKASAGNQSEIARYSAPTLQAPDLGSFGASIADALRMNIAFKQLHADLALKDEQTYTQHMVGLEHQQDYYSKLMDNALKAEIVGYNPGLILSREEMDLVRKSRGLARYEAESTAIDKANRLKQIEYEAKRLSNREKDWLFQNMLPVQLRVQEAIERGASADAAIKEVQKNLEENLGRVGGSSGAVKLLIDFLRTIFR